MTGGSQQPEHVQDKECPHCGLYYLDRGNSFNLHTGACDGGEQDEGTEPGSPSNEDTSPSDGNNSTSSDGDESAVMGSGQLPEEPLPCGHERIKPGKYDPGTVVQCETCGNHYRILDE